MGKRLGLPRIVIPVVVLLLLVLPLVVTFGPQTVLEDSLDFLRMVALGEEHRSDPSAVTVDMRSLATGIEAYYVDHDCYPPARPLTELSDNRYETLRTTVTGLNTISSALTTPIGYVASIGMDRFTADNPRPRFYYKGQFFTHSYDRGKAPFAYHNDGSGWILFSPGPDLDYDIDPVADYASTIPQPSARLKLKAWDPTNGMKSSGDIFRVKQ